MISNYINKLLNIEDVFITNIIHKEKSIEIFISTKPKLHTCPSCGRQTKRIHDYRNQKMKDIPFQFKDCFLILKKRRYHCSCGKHFFESYSFLSRYQQHTRRLVYSIAHELRETVSIKYISKKFNISSATVTRILDTLCYELPSLKKAIAIDEFKGNANTGKYQCILVDPIKCKVLDILPDRTQSHLTSYFRNIPKKDRNQVEFFVCDMWNQYIELGQIYFPNAKIIIDKYHFIRQITWAIDRIRKRLQQTMIPTLRKYYKRSKTLIHKRYNALNQEDKEACDVMLLYHDDLRKSHRLKEWFYNICQEKKYGIQREQFWKWIAEAQTCGIKDFEDVAATYRRFSKGILNAFKYGITNGPTEGFNNKIKVMKRTAYGIKNFKRFRTRILHCTN
jgi:transposase